LETEKTAPSGLYSQRFSQEELRWAMSVVLANAIDSGRGDLGKEKYYKSNKKNNNNNK